MAKQIKAIKCPQCGSSLHTEISDELYKCSNCNTNYFLDSDDININVNHRIDNVNSRKGSSSKLTTITALIVVIGIITSLTFTFLKVKNSSKNRSHNDSYTSTNYRSKLDLPIIIKNRLYMLSISQKQNSSKDIPKEWYYTFMDVKTGKIEKREKMDNFSKENHPYISYSKFSDGKVYLIPNKEKIYQINNDEFNLKDITSSLFQDDSLYTTGIAQVNLLSSNRNGECFDVLTNSGTQYYYYPKTKKSYPAQKIYSYIYSSDKVSPNYKDTIIYRFFDENDTRGSQLLKINFKYNEYDPFKNIAFLGKSEGHFQSKLRERGLYITSYENLTPDRVYMYPSLVYYDNERLFILARTTALETSQLLLQKIDSKTGKLLWTVPLNLKNDRYKHFFGQSIYADGLFILKLDNDEFATVSDKGDNLKFITP